MPSHALTPTPTPEDEARRRRIQRAIDRSGTITTPTPEPEQPPTLIPGDAARRERIQRAIDRSAQDNAAPITSGEPASVPPTPVVAQEPELRQAPEAAALKRRIRGETRLVEIGGLARRFIDPRLEFSRIRDETDPSKQLLSGRELLNLFQGQTELTGSLLREGIQALGDIPGSLSSGEFFSTSGRQDRPFSETLGEQLDAPGVQRIPAEIFGDPFNFLPLGFLGKLFRTGRRAVLPSRVVRTPTLRTNYSPVEQRLISSLIEFRGAAPSRGRPLARIAEAEGQVRGAAAPQRALPEPQVQSVTRTVGSVQALPDTPVLQGPVRQLVAAQPLPAASAILPRSLAGAKPRYNIGQRQFIPEFESDVDKALFIVAQTKPSARDDAYMGFLRRLAPDKSDAEIRRLGSAVRQGIKDLATNSEEGVLRIPATNSLGAPRPTATPQQTRSTDILGDQISEGRASIDNPEQAPTPLTVQERLQSLSEQLVELDVQIEARLNARVWRPRWGVGLSNAELEAVARHEGLNPFQPDWSAHIDPLIVREAKRGRFKVPGAETITAQRRQRTVLRQELREAEREAKEVEIAAQRISSDSPPPPRTPGTPQGADMGTPPPRRTDLALSDDLELPTWEQPSQGIMRKWEGARAAEGLAMEEWFIAGQKLLRDANVTTFDEASMRPLFEALHGERTVDSLPSNLRGIHDNIKVIQQQEEADMLNFLLDLQGSGDPTLMKFDADNFISRMMTSPEYFPRLWKQDKNIAKQAGTARGRLGATPGLAKARVDATFSELLASGKEPASWNPYTMMAMRRIAGVEYRESVKLVNRLTRLGLAGPVDEVPIAGFRVPRDVGPVFNGRPILNAQGDTVFSRQIAVRSDVADFLEGVFGTPSHIPGMVAIRTWSNRAKRFKLFASLFQHLDFGFRTLGAAASPTALRKNKLMAPFKTISLAGKLLEVSVSPGARNTLRRDLLSNKPIFKDGSFEITPRMLIEEGWGVQGDISLIRREFTGFLSTIEGSGPINQIKKAQRFFEEGLFDGVYRESQRWALENFIVPWVRRTRPKATPRQVAAESAEAVNVMFSTLGNWQTVLKNPILQDVARTTFFSSGESESLLRGAGRAVSRPGRAPTEPQTGLVELVQGRDLVGVARVPFRTSPTGGLFREWYLGLFISMVAIANVINLVATGKPLPASSYNPVKLDDPYAPFGIGYNNRFLSPQIPFVKGRNGSPIYIDIVGQMDTAFRWGLDPVGAIASRTNVIPRAIWNQVKGETFFGEKLDTFAKRMAQLGIDLAAPISATSAIGAAREGIPALRSVVPEGEGRLGVTGQLVQTGINLNAEKTGEFLDRQSRELFNGTPHDDIEPYMKKLLAQHPSVAPELVRRNETSAARGRERASAEVDKKLLQTYDAILDDTLTPEEGVRAYYKATDIARGARGEALKDVDFGDPDLEKLMGRYNAIFDDPEVRRGPFLFNVEKLQEKQDALLKDASEDDQRKILRNSNMRPVPRNLIDALGKTGRRIQASQFERERHLRLMGKPELAKLSNKLFYAPVIPEFDPAERR